MSDAVNEEMRQIIEAQICQIERDEQARVLFAVESGSRAWGFHSPDSDYDVRFIYVRPVEWHLSLAKKRDVIERPISDELDVSGWDLGKALTLTMKSNAVIAEWLQSPIVYRRQGKVEEVLSGFAQRALSRRPVTWHYLSILSSYLECASNGDTVRVKAFFYALRPALALRWMRVNGRAVPPMNMDRLIEGANLQRHVIERIERLIERKKSLLERAQLEAVDPALFDLLKQEADAARTWLSNSDDVREDQAGLLLEADKIHREFVLGAI